MSETCLDAVADQSYDPTMKTDSAQTLTDAERAEEKERARRKREALVMKDCRQAKTRLEDTPFAREAWALGEKYRKSQRSP